MQRVSKLIQVRNLSFGYSKKLVLNSVNFSIEDRESVLILGVSGSGKTTLLHLIGALDRPTEGRVLIKGTDISELNDDELAELRNREIGFVFQFFNLISRMTAVENVELPMAFAGVPREKRRERSIRLLEKVGLGDRVNHRPTELSGGEQQRISIARAFVNRPPILLADEPTGNLDPTTSEGIMKILSRINLIGTTVVMATHDRSIVNSMRRRVVELEEGEIIRDQKRGVYGD